MPCSYRLGPHGFLYSEELKEAGYKANNGLRDQRAALLWIQQYISGFGGDPSNVTLMGESAGGVAVCYHLHSEKPLFKRAMAMSGLSLLMPILPLPATEHFYNVAIKALGLESKSKEDRVHQLLSMDGQELRNVCMKAGVATFPALDGDLLSVLPTFENIMSGEIDMPGRQWCEGILLGDCQFDVGHLKRPITWKGTDSSTGQYTSTQARAPEERFCEGFRLLDPTLFQRYAWFRGQDALFLLLQRRPLRRRSFRESARDCFGHLMVRH